MPNMTQAGYTPPKKEPKKAPAAPKKAGKKKKGKKKVNGVAVASLVIFFAAMLIGAATIYIYVQTQAYTHTYLAGTSLDHYPLGGASQEDAQELLRRMTQEPVSLWQFEMTYMGQKYTLTANDVLLEIDEEATLEPLWQQGRDGNMLSRYLKMLSLRRNPVNADPVLLYNMDPVDALLERIAADIEREPVDASMTFQTGSSTPFQISGEQTGLALHTGPLREQIEQAIKTLTPVNMVLVPQEIPPEVYRSELEEIIILRSRVVMRIAADEASLNNVKIAAQKLNGISLQAGETLSFNETVGKRTAEAGYASAPEPAYGLNVSGVGGGVCQASSAVYQAALLAGIGVLERNAAAYPVSYCEMGQEAAVSDQGLDLVIQNTTAYLLFMTARAYAQEEEAYIEVQIIGEALDRRYALESSVQETGMIEEPVYVRDHAGSYARYTDERVPVGKAQPGYQAVVERVEIGKDAQETAREVISEDVYEAIPPTVYVGIEERE